MAEEDGGDGGWGEAADDGVEEGSGIGETVGTVVTGGDVTDDPGALSGGFTGFELGD